MSENQLEPTARDPDKDGEETEWEPTSISIQDGECVILDRDLFIEELDSPILLTMRGQQVWIWWYKDGAWIYSEIKGEPKAEPPKRKPAKEPKEVVTPIRKRATTVRGDETP